MKSFLLYALCILLGYVIGIKSSGKFNIKEDLSFATEDTTHVKRIPRWKFTSGFATEDTTIIVIEQEGGYATQD